MSGKGREAGVSVFRAGRGSKSRAVTLDLATGREIFGAPLPVLSINPAKVWEQLSPVSLSAGHLAGNTLFPAPSAEPAGLAFDQLRSQVLRGLKDRGWRRIAVTGPARGAGASFVAANLALALARRPGSRTVLVDLDLRAPSLGQRLGLADLPDLTEFLAGEQPLESIFRRFGKTLALGLNAGPSALAAELLHSPETAIALDSMVEQLDPEVVIYDLPPALEGDDLLALAPVVDAVLLVTDGGRSSPDQIRACEALLGTTLPLFGVVMNRVAPRPAWRNLFRRG